MSQQAQAPQAPISLTYEQLQELMRAAREPNEFEREKLERERDQRLGRAKHAAELAKSEEAQKARRWDGCAHYETYNGRKFWKWMGQVNSDGMVYPVCNLCHCEAPPFSASLLPEGGKQGVSFEAWNDPSRQMLIALHQKTFPKGCQKATCPVCHPKK